MRRISELNPNEREFLALAVETFCVYEDDDGNFPYVKFENHDTTMQAIAADQLPEDLVRYCFDSFAVELHDRGTEGTEDAKTLDALDRKIFSTEIPPMTLTRNVAIAMAKGFAAYAVEYSEGYVPSDPDHKVEEFDCVVAEESDAYQSFIAELYYTPETRGMELNWDAIDADPMYQLFRKTLYAHALILHRIKQEMARLHYTDADVVAMQESWGTPDVEGQALLDMLIAAAPKEQN